MKSGRERQNSSYHSNSKCNKGNKGNSGRGNRAGVSLGFCWAFGLVVCLTFGLASFLMFSAGHFNFSPDTGVTAAWGDNTEENLITGSLITVEVTELEAKLKDPIERESQYLLARNNGNVIEEFGPLPKYLSDYESIQLTRDNDGTKLPEDIEEDDDIPINHEPDIHVEQPILEETGPFWKEHVVKSGETLSDIAKEYGNITAQDILRANGLKDANRLSENQLLLIPMDSDKIEDTLDEVRTRQMRVAATKEKVE
ncbi:MAG: LysM peptidoglycan-binding domain-containing protein, partial [Synergistaceae bacterium]|nr:LysM peptidoglycan-binding domain-containing protein [Synergistaceae bacterium]